MFWILLAVPHQGTSNAYNNKCFCGEIRKIQQLLSEKSTLSVAMNIVSAMKSFSGFNDCNSKLTSFRNVHFICAFPLAISIILKSVGKKCLVLKKATH